MDERRTGGGPGEIQAYIEELKFRRCLLFGFHPVDVYEKLAELQRLYTAELRRLQAELEAAGELERGRQRAQSRRTRVKVKVRRVR